MNTRRILGLALVVVAMGVAIVLRSAADSAAKPGDVNEARVLSDAATGNNWLLNGRTFDAGHFSPLRDRKSTRLNSSHSQISYAVFCLKKKKNNTNKSTSHNHKTMSDAVC